jgi:hypothetical protein
MPAQIEQFAAHLQSRQAEELAHRGWLDLLQRAKQTEQGILQHVVGLRPPLDLGEAAKHVPGEEFQPGGEAPQELITGGRVAGAHALQPAV